MCMAAGQYALDLPDPSTLRALFTRAIDMYRTRDEYITKFREALDGRNPVAVPQSMQYKAVAKHTYHLRAVVNEKTSRYRRIPEMKVVPLSVSKTAEREANKLEKAINVALDTIDLQSGGNVWWNVINDVHALDAGVERWERAPAAFWPELVVGEDGEDNFSRIYQDKDQYEKKKEDYIKNAGLPIRRVYVPLERFYPIVEGATIVEAFELEERSLRSVLAHPKWDTAALRGYNTGTDGGMSQKVVILHYSNQRFHAYYALGPSQTNYYEWPRLMSTQSMALGQPMLLDSYEHGLGETVYNYVVGRGGGWINGASYMDGVMKAILELNQDADELHSQVSTYIRNVMWPTRVAYYDPDARQMSDGTPPKPPVIPEGGTIGMFKGEKIENIVQALPEFALAEWVYGTTKDRISELAGSPVLFGDRAPGVTTGYHQQLQISQAEHLDAMLEANLARGAVGGVVKFLKHLSALDEKVWVVARMKKGMGKGSRIYGEYTSIDPRKLDPIPQLAAKVRDPRPTDVLTGVQAVMQMTQIRPGHNTAFLPDDYAAETFLGIEDYDELELKRFEQDMRNQLLNNNQLITQTLGIRLGLALAQREGANITEDTVSGASPAFQQATQEMNQSGESAEMGGVSPNNAAAMITGSAAPAPDSGMGGALQGVGGGMAPGNPQASQTAGRARGLMTGG